MAEMEVLVLGATGTTGRRVAARLDAAGVAVRPASRGGTVRFDWAEPATWPAAVTGAAAVYLMAPDGQPVEPGFVRLAVEQGVRRIVLLSSRGIETMGDERLLAAERTVRGSGVEWTIVRPDWFNQNFDSGVLRDAVLAGELALPVGDARQAFVDADDIAAVAVAALTGEGHAGQTYEVTGPRPLSFPEALAIIERHARRPVTYRGEADDYRAAMAGFGLPAEQTEREIAAFAALRRAGDAEPTDVVPRVTGRPAVDFESYATAAAARGAWRA